MLDYSRVWKKELTLADLTADLSLDDLRNLTNRSIDTLLALIAECEDADVTFQPVDPDAHDDQATAAAEVNLPWTLGHVIAHTTAGGEETAFLAAELARGVPNHGRSRSEVPWERLTRVAQLRQRLEESRRMRLASLAIWPDQPDLDLHVTFPFLEGSINAKGYFVLGLMHEESHFAQVRDIVSQARVARDR